MRFVRFPWLSGAGPIYPVGRDQDPFPGHQVEPPVGSVLWIFFNGFVFMHGMSLQIIMTQTAYLFWPPWKNHFYAAL
jgi:hypothetical protein